MAELKLVILAERRDFVRSCLTCWVDTCCERFRPLAVADIESTPTDGALSEAILVLIGVVDLSDTDGWVGRQIEWFRANCPNLPIVLVVDLESVEATRMVEALVCRSGVQGYLPTSTTVTVAGAALDLVVAGGDYFPIPREQRQVSPPFAPSDLAGPAMLPANPSKLTPREKVVLSVLAIGAPNKIIAYRLGMSISTVKAHVHSIITKLNVHNRTQAVLAARVMQAHASEAQSEPIEWRPGSAHTSDARGRGGAAKTCIQSG
jgi:DNA-binding NarL/FixJ family response regulator